MTLKPIADAASNEALLDAFEPDFVPTNAATDERARGAYQRSAFVAAIVAARGEPGGAFQACGIARKKAPKYAGYFWSRSGRLPSYLTVTFDTVPQSQIFAILALATRLAATLEVDYGTAHLTFSEASPLYNTVGRMSPKDLQEFGPMPLGARTWLGPHIAGLIGRDKIENSGAQVSATPWGALRIDLLDDLAHQPMEALQAKQAAVMKSLAGTGVFAIYQPGQPIEPGPRWTPLV